jgi:hypothetical protein
VIATPSIAISTSPTSTPAAAPGRRRRARPPARRAAAVGARRGRHRRRLHADAEVAAGDPAVGLERRRRPELRVAIGTAQIGAGDERARVHAEQPGRRDRPAGRRRSRAASARSVSRYAIEPTAGRRAHRGADHAERAQRRADRATGAGQREGELAGGELAASRRAIGVRPPPSTRAARRRCRDRGRSPGRGARRPRRRVGDADHRLVGVWKLEVTISDVGPREARAGAATDAPPAPRWRRRR